MSDEPLLARGYLEETRRERRDALVAAGVAPFAYRYDRSHTAAGILALGDAVTEADGESVRVAGRLVAWRGQGKTIFAHLEDASGRIQLYLRRDALADGWEMIQLLDLDDHVGVAGHVFRTRTGEITIRVTAIELLAKALRPLPRGKTEVREDGSTVVHGGLADPEVRFRQRYADFAVHPELREIFRLRARVVSHIRRELDAAGFLEVETPVLQPLYGGASARPFTTHHNALDMPLYLRIADELYLKRLIVGGFERVYEIGHDFRNEGIDRSHNPEFTMLEWYEAYADYHDVRARFERLLAGLVREVTGTTVLERRGHRLDFTPPYAQVSFTEGIREVTGIDVREGDEPAMRAWLVAHGTPADEAAGMSGGRLLDELFGQALEPRLIQPTFLMDYPRALSPLAKPHRDDPRLTERFEFFVLGRELANAFSELNDPDDQRARFEDQLRQRAAGDDEAQQFDADYIRALEYGMPPTGGIGMGIDRLVALLADQEAIRDVILFPAMRPEGSGRPAGGG
ncbi:MAG TPA: lysine--tRNA ligase [Gemmatimonadales bacterium]|nr:lysine--tRNA ligase [Gemmatimonadales bacterium]HRX19417.1 lysine--tRNA ligase [Gemmatimonadales bacterium]